MGTIISPEHVLKIGTFKTIHFKGNILTGFTDIMESSWRKQCGINNYFLCQTCSEWLGFIGNKAYGTLLSFRVYLLKGVYAFIYNLNKWINRLESYKCYGGKQRNF